METSDNLPTDARLAKTKPAVGNRTAGRTVTREMVHIRACELALLNRRNGGLVCQADYEQAKEELTGERDIDRQEAALAVTAEQGFGDGLMA